MEGHYELQSCRENRSYSPSSEAGESQLGYRNPPLHHKGISEKLGFARILQKRCTMT